MAGTKPGKYNDGKQQIKQFKEGSRHEDRLSFCCSEQPGTVDQPASNLPLYPSLRERMGSKKPKRKFF
jgi:hypothetical protein